MPAKRDLPDTLKRSPREAQETYAKALDSAHESYRSEERAHRTAIAALKHSFEKVGDHWERKRGKGPSDPRAERGRGEEGGRSYGGVDVEGSTKQELYERARQLDIPGRSSMSKRELASAVAEHQD